MVSAGEVEQYVYCPHNWLLARKGVDGKGAASARGIDAHKAEGRAQSQVELDKKEYRSALNWALRLLGVAASATFLTLELIFLRASPQHYILLSVALVLLASSGGLLVIALVAQERYKEAQKDAGLVPGTLVDSDLVGGGRLLRDPARDLTGTPDYVLQTPHGYVPVEVKSGKTPERPHANHLQQVACYLALIEANTGKAPEYGLLTYPQGTFRVSWDDAQRQALEATLARIRLSMAAGVADRDHQQPGRCRGCARRDACEQRLA
ncbi:MAG TPA: PD-(D/E)XK nuclease family protein [Candidatus Thermoplasmatota archaeon]|nr:PD-(D/E)XK nuclease family protein [Candidatus Thermoplasmatota archaeon]